MRSSHSLDRVGTAFDDDRLVADAGLLMPATVASHLGLRELVDEHPDLGDKAETAEWPPTDSGRSPAIRYRPGDADLTRRTL